MFNTLFKKYWPHGLFLILFLALSAAYFSPLISGKKVMFQHDIQQAKGMAHEIEEYKEKSGESSLWTNSMFSGMPAYQIGSAYPANLVRYAFSAITYMLGYDRYPISSLWMLMTCFFILLIVFDVNVWIAGAVSIAYGFSSFNIIGIEAGHANKIWTLMYAPLILAAVQTAFKGKYLAGMGLAAFALAMNVYANHVQVTYYFFIAVLIWGLIKLVYAIRENELKNFLLASVFLIIGAGVGISTNTSSLWTTYEYGKESTRGGSELTEVEKDNNAKGLDYTYIFDDYSYGRFEQITFLVPNFYGGASGMDLPKESEVAKLAGQNKGMPTYWGAQRYVAGPYYLGAIVCFLVVLGILLTRNNSTKIWILVTAFFTLSLAMGKNSLFLSDTFFNYFPFYSKFRTPTMITAVTQVMFAMLAALGLQALLENYKTDTFKKKLNLAFYITGGLCLLLAIGGSAFFDFSSPTDDLLQIQDPEMKRKFLEALASDRASLMQKDAFRSLIFVALAFGLVWAWTRQKLNLMAFSAALSILMLADLWTVNTRYMSNTTYKNKSKKGQETLFTPTVADQQILQDKDLDFRVANLSVSTFNDATTSYFHKSIGGYHGAKLRRYQELISHQISPELQTLTNTLRASQDLFVVDSILRTGMPVLNMLNTRYYILNPEGAPLKNTYANGNAWLIKNLKVVKNADEELMGLSGLDTKTSAVVDERWKDQLGNFSPNPGSTGSVKMISYAPNKLVYDFNSNSEEVVAFSEVFYPYGWIATIDGQEVPHFRVNYVLRALKVPAGTHKIEFRFEPKSYITGEKISFASSVILILLCGGVVVAEVMRSRKAA